MSNLYLQRLFEVTEPNRAGANRILEGCARRKVKDIMYQARVDAVKIYYDDQGEELDDTLACSRELTLEQYLASRVDWFSPTVWPHICRYWCSNEFKQARARGQASRLKSLDVAQNRGGSRPFSETRQYLVCHEHIVPFHAIYLHRCLINYILHM
jgi:hypothetical protein